MKRAFRTLMAAWLLQLPLAAATAADCNRNGIDDAEEIAEGASRDCNVNGVPDECELEPGSLTFEASRIFPNAGDPYSYVVADFDEDGDPDVATAGLGIRILENRGDGDFAAGDVSLESEWRRWEVLGADLDADGSTDLVAVAHSTPEVAILRNRGDGTFLASSEPLVPHGAHRPAFADVDGDGHLDLLAAGARDVSPGSTRYLGEVYWMRNSGDGTFEPARVLWPVERAGSFVAEDLDGDGAIDLAVTETAGRDESPGEVAILRGRADGTFVEPELHPVGFRASLLPQTVDLDGDGGRDLVVLNRLTKDLSLLRGMGDGTFDVAGPVPIPHSSGDQIRLRSSDLDRDGDSDLIAAVWQGRDSTIDIAVLRSDGSGGFDTTVYGGVVGNLSDLQAADLTGDDLPEIVTVQLASGSVSRVSVRENLDEAGFAVAQTFRGSSGTVGDPVTIDVDGDRDADMVLRWAQGVELLENVTGAAGLQRGCEAFLRGDVNMDGAVSVSDLVMFRRLVFEGDMVSCAETGDVTDDESLTVTDSVALLHTLFLRADWSLALPEPSVEPGLDPTPAPVPGPFHEDDQLDPEARLGCAAYRVEPVEATGDVIRLGSVVATPGAEVRVPVYVSSSVPVEAVQLVLRHDPDVLEILPDSLTYERTFYEEAFSADPDWRGRPEVSALTVHPAYGVATAAIAGRLTRNDRKIPPGTDTLIAWIKVRVAEDVRPDSVLRLDPTNGEDGAGIGPYRLRNEICHQGDARLVSTIPRLEGAVFNIVPDQAFFRGDANGDETLDVSDAVHTLDALFIGDRTLGCEDAADANDDGQVDISDAVSTLGFLFLGGPALPLPHPNKGFDPTSDTLSCSRFGPSR